MWFNCFRGNCNKRITTGKFLVSSRSTKARAAMAWVPSLFQLQLNLLPLGGLGGNDSERFYSGTFGRVTMGTPPLWWLWYNFLWRHWGIQIMIYWIRIEVGTSNFGLTRLQTRNGIIVTDVTRGVVLFCKCTSLKVDVATVQQWASKRFIHVYTLYKPCIYMGFAPPAFALV